MPFKNPRDKALWRALRRDKDAEYLRNWKASNPDRVRLHEQRTKERRRIQAREREDLRKHMRPSNYRELQRERSRLFRIAIRRSAIERLGGVCRCCGFSDQRALHIDHREPLLRRTTGRMRKDSYQTAREVLTMESPLLVFDLLCANCHQIKTRENGEHDGSRWRAISASRGSSETT